MAILNTAGIQRKPTHPGKMLREDFLPDYGLTVSGLAESLGVARQSVDELLRERRAVSPEMALRLARLFGNTPEFWLNTQRSVDITMPCTGCQTLRFAAVLSPVIAGVSFLAKQWRSNESKNDSRYRNGIGDAGRKISSL